MKQPSPLGTAIARLRLQRRLTLRDLASLSGVSHSNIHGLETGRQRSAGADTLVRLARGLGVDPSVLLAKARASHRRATAA